MMLETSSWTPSFFEDNTEQCLNALKDQKLLEQIPALNTIAADISALDKKLVRFRGMIQDILNPVYYVERLKIHNVENDSICYRSGKYRDVYVKDNEKVVHDYADNQYHEKQMMHCIKIPGMNSWTKQFTYVDEALYTSKREGKRKLDSDVNSTEMDVEESAEMQTGAECSHKKISTEEDVRERNESRMSNAGTFESAKLNELDEVCGVLLNLYDCDNIKVQVNDVFEAIGFLSLKTNEESMDDEKNYYDSLPRIHVINMVQISSVFDSLLSFQKDQIFSNAVSLRDELWIMLTDLLLGDTLAADYVICHLISSVYLRKNDLALGKFALNISNTPNKIQNFEYVRSLYSFLAHLLEKSVYLPITIPNLNSTTMIPKQNNEENRLITGLLQVSNRTHFVIDETQLETGQLFDRGVRNTRALSDIISTQRIEYDFEFYKLPYNTDIPILTLSSGKSLFPCDAHLALDPDKSCIQNVSAAFNRTWQKMADPLLSKLRVYLNVVSSIDFNITPAMQQTIEIDFVRMRSDDNNRVSVEDLHRLMVLSRLMAVSKGFNTLHKDVWEHTCQMETQRKARLP